MLRLRVVQALFGDSLILEHGTSASPRYVLVDGGPPTTYADHLRGELAAIAAGGGKLELCVLSHVDNDHVIGLLDLFAELRDQRANGDPQVIEVGGLWHNAFTQTVGSGAGRTVPQRLTAAIAGVSAASRAVLATAERAFQGIAEGNRLRTIALQLGTAINDGFPGRLIRVDDAPGPIVLGDLTLRVVGPTQKNVDELRTKWLEWLDEHEDELADPQVAAMADRSVPNLSSIMLLAEAGGKRLLLTGDGRGDHLLDGLEVADLLDDDDGIHVDVLKLPHHGSDRNVTKRFFRTVTADVYVASANGKDGNPDLTTLRWIVEAAETQGRAIEIVVTNETDSVKRLRKELPPAQHGYALRVLAPDRRSLTVELAT